MRAGSGLWATAVLLGFLGVAGASAADLSREKARLLSMGLLSTVRPDVLVEGGAGMPALMPRDAYASLPGVPASPVADERPASLGLLQQLALLFAPASNSEPASVPVAYAPMPATEPSPPVPEYIPYSGPIAAGTVVINISQLEIFRIREGGWAERYRVQTQDALFAMVGSLR